MADYAEEQKSEIEALQAMYSEEELQVLDDFKGFLIKVASEEGEEDEQLSMELEVEYVPEYPDEVPLICLKPLCEVEESVVKDLQAFVLDAAEENRGMVMGFALVSSLQSELNMIIDRVREQREIEANKKQEVQRLKDEMRLKGTPVTPESFMAWKESFDKEMSKLGKISVDTTGQQKSTGRQMFERDASLAKSDAQLIDDD